MTATLLWLVVGAFAVGTEGFMIAGLLPAMSRDLGVSLETAGQLITVFSLTYAIGSPVLATLTSGIDRKRLLIGALAILVVANILAALSPSYGSLMAARVLMAMGSGLYMPAAMGVSVSLLGPERRGRAVALVSIGTTVAVTVGVPLGVVIAGFGNWRMPFVFVAAAALVTLVGFAVALPAGLPRSRTSLAQRIAVIARPGIAPALGTTVMWIAGAGVVYTYIAAFLEGTVGVSSQWLTLTLVLFGGGGALGNALGGTLTDRIGWQRMASVSIAGLVAIFLLIAVVARLPVPGAAAAMLLLVTAWGLVGWMAGPAQGTRLVGLAPDVAVISLSLNSSAIYLGFAVGAVLGSVTLSVGSLHDLPLVSAACEIAAFALARAAVRPRPVAATACPGTVAAGK